MIKILDNNPILLLNILIKEEEFQKKKQLIITCRFLYIVGNLFEQKRTNMNQLVDETNINFKKIFEEKMKLNRDYLNNNYL